MTDKWPKKKEIIKFEKVESRGQKEGWNACHDAFMKVINQHPGYVETDKVTLAFFQKYLEMPDANINDLCREIIRLKESQ